MYFLITATFNLSLSTAFSKIVYTDIPDGPLITGIDFNGDAIIDIENKQGNGNGIDYLIYDSVPGQNSVIVWGNIQTTGWDEAAPLAGGVKIDAASNWAGAEATVPSYNPPGNPNNFPNGIDTYLGAKFMVGANTYYGWIRVNGIVAGGNCTNTYKDFAYEDVPDKAINAGDVGIGTSVSPVNSILTNTIFTYTSSGVLNFNSAETFQFVKVCDVSGRELLHQLNVHKVLDLSHLVIPGVYLLFVGISNQISTSKILLQ